MSVTWFDLTVWEEWLELNMYHGSPHGQHEWVIPIGQSKAISHSNGLMRSCHDTHTIQALPQRSSTETNTIPKEAWEQIITGNQHPWWLLPSPHQPWTKTRPMWMMMKVDVRQNDGWTSSECGITCEIKWWIMNINKHKQTSEPETNWPKVSG